MLNKNESFKDVFENFKAEPDPEVWMGIQSDLKGNKKKRGMLFWSSGAALLLLFLFVLCLNQSSDTSQTLKTPELQKNHIVENDNSSLAENNVIESNGKEGIIEVVNENLKTMQHASMASPTLWKLKQEEESKNTTGNSLAEISEVINLSSEAFAMNLREPVAFKDSELFFQGNEQVKYLNYKRKVYAIELLMGKGNAGFMGLGLKPKNQPVNAMTLGLNFIKNTGKSEWKLGFNYLHTISRFEHQWDEMYIREDSFKIKKRYSDVTRYHYFNDTSWGSFKNQFVNKVNQFNLRLSYSHLWQINRNTEFYSDLGIAALCQFNTRLAVGIDDKSDVEMQSTPHQKSYNQYGFGASVGAGILYQIRPGLKVNLGLNASLQYLDYRVNNQLVTPYQMTLNLGIRKSLFSHATLSN